jgi:triacylglycerol lipase
MLSSLLRWIIFVLCVVGGGVGYGLVQWNMDPRWVALLLAAVSPFWTLLLIVGVTMFKSRPEKLNATWWRTLLGEYRAGVHVFLLRQPWTLGAPRIQDPTVAPPQPRIPVVLVHGYMCNHRTWDDLAHALRAAGHTVFAVNLEPLFTSIERFAPTIDAAVSSLCQHTGASQVALVGHSMGGVAIRAWMRQNGTGNVARVLTLGSPHAGTQVDRHPLTPNGRQMLWQSEWLTELAASESVETRALMRVALATHDNIVYPQRAQVLPGVHTTVFEGMAHMQLCLEPQPIAWVCAQLANLVPNTAQPHSQTH